MRISGNRSGHLLSKKALLWVTTGVCALLIFFVTSIYGFLAVNQPVGKGILVVEGWIPERTLAESIHVFNSGGYQYLVVVGGPITETGRASGHLTTYADLAASRLEQLGFDTKKLIKINVPGVSSERTLTGAVYVQNWLQRSESHLCCVDIFTAGVHARKSWILFRYGLGGSYRVGIIAGPEASFDPKYWFVSSTGIWIVARNSAGYLYYKFWILFGGKASLNQASSIVSAPPGAQWHSLLPRCSRPLTSDRRGDCGMVRGLSFLQEQTAQCSQII